MCGDVKWYLNMNCSLAAFETGNITDKSYEAAALCPCHGATCNTTLFQDGTCAAWLRRRGMDAHARSGTTSGTDTRHDDPPARASAHTSGDSTSRGQARWHARGGGKAPRRAGMTAGARCDQRRPSTYPCAQPFQLLLTADSQTVSCMATDGYGGAEGRLLLCHGGSQHVAQSVEKVERDMTQSRLKSAGPVLRFWGPGRE